MALEWKRNYTNKEGVVVDLKYPQVYLIGKHLGKDDEHVWVLLGEGIQESKHEFGKPSMFMKKYNKDQEANEPAFIVELSNQLYNSIKKEQLTKFDVIKFTRGEVEDTKTGAIRPIVKYEFLFKKKVSLPVTDNKQKALTEFAEMYKEVAEVKDRNLPHFVGSYVIYKQSDKELTAEAEKVWKETMVTEEDIE